MSPTMHLMHHKVVGRNLLFAENKMRCEVRKLVSGVATRSYTNWPVQSQKKARILKFRI